MSYFAFEQRLSPEDYARELLHKHNISEFPVDLEYIIRGEGIKLRVEDLGTHNFDGCLIRKNGQKLIILNSAIPYEGRKNFSLCHELGHATIKGHDKEKYTCSGIDIESYSLEEKKAESEANRFASELLMPVTQVDNFLKKRDISFDTIQELSKKFGASLTAAALKTILNTKERVALVASSQGQVLWDNKSPTFRYEIRKGKLHEHSYAVDAFMDKELPDQFKEVLGYAWLDDRSISRDFEILEHSLHFKDLGMTLTLLSIPVRVTNYDEEDELLDL